MDWNSFFCGNCGDGGELLECDGICLRSFHVACLAPEHLPAPEDPPEAPWCPPAPSLTAVSGAKRPQSASSLQQCSGGGIAHWRLFCAWLQHLQHAGGCGMQAGCCQHPAFTEHTMEHSIVQVVLPGEWHGSAGTARTAGRAWARAACAAGGARWARRCSSARWAAAGTTSTPTACTPSPPTAASRSTGAPPSALAGPATLLGFVAHATPRMGPAAKTWQRRCNGEETEQPLDTWKGHMRSTGRSMHGGDVSAFSEEVAKSAYCDNIALCSPSAQGAPLRLLPVLCCCRQTPAELVFTCPAHYCQICHVSGDAMKMMRCWRCPVAYHSRCSCMQCALGRKPAACKEASCRCLYRPCKPFSPMKTRMLATAHPSPQLS